MSFLRQLFGSSAAAVSAAEAQARLQQPDAPLVLDVRQPHEFKSGHIPGAKLIPLSELPARMKQLPQNRPIIVVCRSGSRSGRAAQMLVKMGYEVENLRGGMLAWQAAGFPVKQGGSQ